MKLNSKVLKYQAGGEIPADPAMEQQGAPAPEQGAPAPGGQDEMMAQLQQIATEIIQQMGPDAAAMLAQMIMEMLQGGGGEQLPPEEQQPVYQRNGGRLVRIR